MTWFAGGQALRANVNVAQSQTDNAYVTAVSGKSIQVLALALLSGGTATNVTLNSKGSGAGTAISPLFAAGANSPVVLPFNPAGWFQTNEGEALTVTTGAGAATGVVVTYALV